MENFQLEFQNVLTLCIPNWIPRIGNNTETFVNALDKVNGIGVSNTGQISVIIAEVQLTRSVQTPRRKHQLQRRSCSVVHSAHVLSASQSLIEYFRI